MTTATDALVTIVWALVVVIVLSFAASSVKVPKEWERMAVLRLGKFRGMRGPGAFLRIPIIDQVA